MGSSARQSSHSAYHLPVALSHPEAGARLTEVGFDDVRLVCVQSVGHKLAPGVLSKEPVGNEQGEAGHEDQEPGTRDQKQGKGHPKQERKCSWQLQEVAEGVGDTLSHAPGEQAQDPGAVALLVFSDVVRSHGRPVYLSLKVHQREP